MIERTYYTLTWQEDQPTEAEAAAKLAKAETLFRNRPGYQEFAENFEEDDIPDDQRATPAGCWEYLISRGMWGAWEGHTHYLDHLSRAWPEVLFTLHGEGEQPPDDWREYYRNGQLWAVSAGLPQGGVPGV